MSWMKQASGLLLPQADLAACKFRFGVTDSSQSCCGEPTFVKVTITGIEDGNCELAHCHLISPLVVYLPITSFSAEYATAGGSSALDHYFWVVCPLIGISEHYGGRYSAYVTINTNPAATRKISIRIGKWNYPYPNWVFDEIAEFYTSETIPTPLRNGWSHTFSGSYEAKELTNGPLCDFSGYTATVKIVSEAEDDETVISSSYGKRVLADYETPEQLLLTLEGVTNHPDTYEWWDYYCTRRYNGTYVCEPSAGLGDYCSGGIHYQSPLRDTGVKCTTPCYNTPYSEHTIYARGVVDIVPLTVAPDPYCSLVAITAGVKLYAYWSNPPVLEEVWDSYLSMSFETTLVRGGMFHSAPSGYSRTGWFCLYCPSPSPYVCGGGTLTLEAGE